MKLLRLFLFSVCSVCSVGHLGAQPTPTPTATALTVNKTTGAITAPVIPSLFASGNGLLTPSAANAAYQPLDSDLTAIAALTTTSYGRSFLPLVDAAAARTLLGLGTLATQSGTSSGTNTGDNAVNSLYSGLVSNASHTGDASGSTVLTLATVNSNVGSFGTVTAAPTFTVNGKGLITAAGTATITPAVGSITGLGTGVATALAANVGSAGAPVVFNGALGTPASGVATNLTGTASGLTAGTVTTNANLTGEVTSVGNTATVANYAVLGKVLTGYTSGAGTVAATDSILQAVQKLNGNDGNLQPLDAELTAFAGISSNGFFTRTGAGTAAARTLTGTAAEITVSFGDGVSGNPTLSLPTALTFTGKTVTGGTFASATFNGTVGATTPSTGAFTSVGLGNFTVAPATAAILRISGTQAINTLQGYDGTNAYNITLFNGLSSSVTIQSTGSSSFSNGINATPIGTGGASTVAATTISATGAVDFGTTSASGRVTLGQASSGVVDSTFVFRTGSTKTAWQLGAQSNVDNGFEVTPSTAVGGTTFTTPVFRVTTTGISATGNITGTGVYSTTTGSAANVFVDSGGLLQRSTSSLRYKTDLKPYERGLADAAKLHLFTYRAKDKPDSTERFAGVGAEEMHTLGFTEFVEYGPVSEEKTVTKTDEQTGAKKTGTKAVATKTLQPEAVRYANMVVWAFACINELAAKNDSLTARVAELEKANASFDARMAAVEALLKK
jgi:hypothetical protein